LLKYKLRDVFARAAFPHSAEDDGNEEWSIHVDCL